MDGGRVEACGEAAAKLPACFFLNVSRENVYKSIPQVNPPKISEHFSEKYGNINQRTPQII